MRISLLVFILLTCNQSLANVTKNSVFLGNTKIDIIQKTNGPGKFFIHVHQNESTALKAAQKIVSTRGGSLITLKHQGGRNIKFSLHHKHYEFDPNRIYTDRGIKKTLSTFGEYSLEAHSLIKGLAHAITKLLPNGKIIAVHNNSSYSLKDYFPGHPLANDADKLHFNHKKSYRIFYLLTNNNDYKRLKNMKFNSVLQANNAIDDGSLSIFLKNRDYINVEAGYNEYYDQIDMLKNA